MALAMAMAYLCHAMPHEHGSHLDLQAPLPVSHHHDHGDHSHDHGPQPVDPGHHHALAQHLDSHSVRTGPRDEAPAPVVTHLAPRAPVVPAAVPVAVLSCGQAPPAPDDPVLSTPPARAPPAAIA